MRVTKETTLYDFVGPTPADHLYIDDCVKEVKDRLYPKVLFKDLTLSQFYEVIYKVFIEHQPVRFDRHLFRMIRFYSMLVSVDTNVPVRNEHKDREFIIRYFTLSFFKKVVDLIDPAFINTPNPNLNRGAYLVKLLHDIPDGVDLVYNWSSEYKHDAPLGDYLPRYRRFVQVFDCLFPIYTTDYESCFITAFCNIGNGIKEPTPNTFIYYLHRLKNIIRSIETLDIP